MKNPDAKRCWEVVTGRTVLLTVHDCPRPKAVKLAEAETYAQADGQVKLRQVAHCVCRITGPQPQIGTAAVIVAPSDPDYFRH